MILSGSFGSHRKKNYIFNSACLTFSGVLNPLWVPPHTSVGLLGLITGCLLIGWLNLLRWNIDCFIGYS